MSVALTLYLFPGHPGQGSKSGIVKKMVGSPGSNIFVMNFFFGGGGGGWRHVFIYIFGLEIYNPA